MCSNKKIIAQCRQKFKCQKVYIDNTAIKYDYHIDKNSKPNHIIYVSKQYIFVEKSHWNIYEK